jgi:hypothetical protein
MDRKGGATFSWYEKVCVWGGASFQNCQAKQKISTAWSSGQYCFASMLEIKLFFKTKTKKCVGVQKHSFVQTTLKTVWQLPPWLLRPCVTLICP